jgi:hypothetical protein
VTARAILNAFSFASAPPFVKKNTSMSPGVSLRQFRSELARGSVASTASHSQYNGLLLDCLDDANGSPWPMFTGTSTGC